MGLGLVLAKLSMFQFQTITLLFNKVLSLRTKGIIIPDSVTSIGDYAGFYNWEANNQANLLLIPEIASRVLEDAFRRIGIKQPAVNIPNSVTSIGEWAFS